MDFSSTKDILFLALAVAILVLAGFLCWLIYALGAILRDARTVTREIASGIEKIHGILDTIKETLNTSSSHLALMVGAVKEIVSFYQRRNHGSDEEEPTARTRGRRSRS